MNHQILEDIEELDYDQLEELYGVEISDDGEVYDPCEDREFDSLREWANYMISLEDENNYAHDARIGSKWRFDDDRW